MSTINKKLIGFMYNGSALALASSAFKGNLNSVTGFNAAGTGYISFRPSSTFNSLTQFVQDGVYILDVATVGFDLPGAVLAAGAPPSVAAVINKALMGFLYGGSSPLALASASWKGNVSTITGFNSAGTGYISFKPTSTFNSLTQLVPDGAYIINSTTLGFSLPGAVLSAAVAVPVVNPHFFMVGDSRYQKFGDPNQPSVPDLLVSHYATNSTYNFTNFGTGGKGILNFVSPASNSAQAELQTLMFPAIDAALAAGETPVVVLESGGIDMVCDAQNGVSVTQSIANTKNAITNYIAAVRARGAKVICETIFAVDAAGIGLSQAQAQQVDNVRVAVVDWYRQNWRTLLGAEVLVDTASDSHFDTFSDTANTMYYQDGVHLYEAGKVIHAAIVIRGIDAYVSGSHAIIT